MKLETGTTDRSATYASGSNSSNLIFSYTVQSGDTANDLDYISTSALSTNGGSIKDVLGNDLQLTLPSPTESGSLSANQAIFIDNQSPTITGPSSSTGITSSKAVDEGKMAVHVFQTDEYVNWSISGGEDYSSFSINQYSGSLTFAVSPDYTSPTDSNFDNEYIVKVRATDSANNATDQTLTVTVNQSDNLDVSSHIVGSNYHLKYINDYDGNLHASPSGASSTLKVAYKYQGKLDVNKDGIEEAIYTNKESGRWVTASVDASTGEIDFSQHGKGGTTRVVGIYIDPLVASGHVVQGGPHDSQRRFQNDLVIDNLSAKSAGDYDSDGFQEIYWKTNDGTAYLRALMHADGNIQYANYQSEDQMRSYLINNGFGSEIDSITS